MKRGGSALAGGRFSPGMIGRSGGCGGAADGWAEGIALCVGLVLSRLASIRPPD
ncbi:MAG: hypothetical protein AMXMBFR47_04920 [Planctomycetota bacterium]